MNTPTDRKDELINDEHDELDLQPEKRKSVRLRWGRSFNTDEQPQIGLIAVSEAYLTVTPIFLFLLIYFEHFVISAVACFNFFKQPTGNDLDTPSAVDEQETSSTNNAKDSLHRISY